MSKLLAVGLGFVAAIGLAILIVSINMLIDLIRGQLWMRKQRREHR